jgi:ABC-2 type transport system permease protein
MASNRVLNPTKDRRWFFGFGNMFYKQNHQWWGTRSWLIQFLVWAAIINGMLLYFILSALNSPVHQAGGGAGSDAVKSAVADEGILIYFVFAGLMAAAGVAIKAQDALIGEKRSGTAAWVLSKPISRYTFVLAKLAADVIGILVTMVIAQGVIAYFIFKAFTNLSPSFPNCLAAMGLLALMMLFFLCLTYMLGAVSSSRALTIGLPIMLVFGAQFGSSVSILAKIMPWNFIMDTRLSPSLAMALIKGQPLTTVTPIICTAVMTVLFIVVTIWRFQREEF